jgi:hypothetical protein
MVISKGDETMTKQDILTATTETAQGVRVGQTLHITCIGGMTSVAVMDESLGFRMSFLVERSEGGFVFGYGRQGDFCFSTSVEDALGKIRKLLGGWAHI